MNPSTSLLPGFSMSIIATVLLSALATASVWPSGDTDSAFGVVPAGASGNGDTPICSRAVSVAVSPDGETLAVANADNNTVAMIDIDKPGRSEVEGFIPTGWYPTAVLFDETGKRLFVLSGKGLIGQANPRGPAAVSPTADGQYAGQLLQGTVSVIDVPDAAHLATHTARVIELSAYTDAKKLTPAGAPAASPIPSTMNVGASSRNTMFTATLTRNDAIHM